MPLAQELPSPEPNHTPSGGLTHSAYKRTKPMRRWHEAIIDDLLAFPFDTHEARGKRLGYSKEGLCLIINSDMFRAAYAARRAHYTELLDASLAQKLASLGNTMLDVMQESVEQKRTAIPFSVLAESTIGVLEKLGFGGKNNGPSTVVNVQQNAPSALPTISAERLTEARNKLRMVENQKALPSPDEVRGVSHSLSPVPEATPAGEILPPGTQEG